MRRFMSIAVALAAAGVGLIAAPAHANGGTYPSNAPAVASGATVTGGATTIDGYGPNVGGKTGNEFYRVTLGFSDHLVVDFTNVTGYGTGVCVFDPGVTDYTLAQADCLTDIHSSSATSKGHLEYIAPTAGSYLLAVHATDSGKSWAYSANVNVLRASTVTLTGKTTVKAGRSVTLRGQFSPAASVAGLQLQALKSGHWQPISSTNTKPDGTYSFRVKLGAKGRYKLRAYFGGGYGFVASTSPKLKVRVR